MTRYPVKTIQKPIQTLATLPGSNVNTGNSVRSRAGDRTEPVTCIIQESLNGSQTIGTTASPGVSIKFTSNSGADALAGTKIYDPYAMWIDYDQFKIPVTGIYIITMQYKVNVTTVGTKLYTHTLDVMNVTSTPTSLAHNRHTQLGLDGYGSVVDYTQIWYLNLTAGQIYSIYIAEFDTLDWISSASLQVTLVR